MLTRWEPVGVRRCLPHRTIQETTTQDIEAADREDVRRAQSGDRDAFARLVARHGAAATRLAAWLGAGPDTDDVVQEAFVNAWRSLPRFRGDAPFGPWLLRIVANQTRNTVRSRQRRHALTLRALEFDDPLDPAMAAEADERQRALLTAVRSLRPAQRDVVVCRWFLQLSEAETAQTLGIATGTAKSRASRALRALQSALTDPEVSDARG